VARSGVYRAAKPANDGALMRRIDELFTAWPFLASRRMTAMLRAEGVFVNRKRVQRLMRLMGIAALGPKPRTSKPAPGHRIYPYLLRNLTIARANHVWAADITSIPIGRGFLYRVSEGFVYLAAILDAFSRKVVGWAIADHLEASLAIEALDMALAARNPPPMSLIHHSDQGVQYACNAYQKRLETRNIAASMSRVGNPYDNAKAESFMKTLKSEEVDAKTYLDLDDARRQIGAFIEAVYNKSRLHSALGYKPPAEFEAEIRRDNRNHPDQDQASSLN
jgi:putative transposase